MSFGLWNLIALDFEVDDGNTLTGAGQRLAVIIPRDGDYAVK